MRFPLYLNLITAALTLCVMAVRSAAKPVRQVKHIREARPIRFASSSPWVGVGSLATPLVLLIIVAGFLNDSVIRLFMTFGGAITTG